MSLDVWLTTENVYIPSAEDRIFIREDGRNREVSRQEWDRRFPGQEPVVVLARMDDSREVYSANITHNLAKMAREAGIYQYLWRPEEVDIEIANQLIEPLQEGLILLKNSPERFKLLNPENGWGTYEGLISFVHGYLAACKKWPDAAISVSR